MMKAIPVTIQCPQCGSSEVVYSCEPSCCFNHVCSDCLTSFQLVTREGSGKLSDFVVEAARERDICAPTTACALCESLNVLMVEDESSTNRKIVCGDCKSLLLLEFDFDE